MRRSIAVTATLMLALSACDTAVSAESKADKPSSADKSLSADKPSSIVAEGEAKRQDFEWGSLYTYAEGETYGTKDGLAAVAVIKAGKEIHPPHQHAEEEYVLVTEGQGTWHMNGKDRPAKAGDMQYAAPWDLHGITNTGTTPLRFVVWKWNNKGVAVPAQPK